VKPNLNLTLAAVLLCSAGVLPLFSGNNKPAENSWASLKASPGDRELLLRAIETAADLPDNAATLESSAMLVLKRDPADYAGFLALCKAMRSSGRAQEGLSNCKRAMELDPTNYPSYRELGLTYAAAGNPKKAIETLQQGVEISSSSSQAYYNLANILEKRGAIVRAHSYYTKGLTLPLDSVQYNTLLREGAGRTAGKKAKAAVKTPAPKAHRPPAADKQQTAACLAKFREEVLKDGPETALARSEACAQLSPAPPELPAERAPLLVRLGRYEDGVKEYERAAALYGAKDPMAAFCRIKAAETWLKLGDPSKAIAQYKLALASSPGDLNALKGLASAQESISDHAGVLVTYTAILKLEPGNDKVRARSGELKAGLLTNDQILEELHLRQAVDAQKTALLPEDAKLFKAIKTAELSGAVDYLKAKAPGGKGMTVERQSEGVTKLLLTGSGYKSYVFYATRDAVKLFEGRGIGLREVFQLRDLAGAPVFDPSGKLTPEGEEVWRNGAGTQKTWLLPAEPVEESPKAKEARAQMASLEGSGYAEISEPEYLWLLKVTRCPEFTLKNPPVNAAVQLDDGTRPRYMLCYDEKGSCKNQCNSKLASYIASYRENNTAEIESDYSTGFFGRGAIKKHRFCEDGEVWMGGGYPNPCSTAKPAGR